MELKLVRNAYLDFVTLGMLTLPSGKRLATLELPWLMNAEGESCIPEGKYPLRYRYASVMDRCSKGEHPFGWEVSEVPNRSDILFHPANWTRELRGCIALGSCYFNSPRDHLLAANSVTSNLHDIAVADSYTAINEFMDEVGECGDGEEIWLSIESFSAKLADTPYAHTIH